MEPRYFDTYISSRISHRIDRPTWSVALDKLFMSNRARPICDHSPKIFLSRWTTSGGCAITSVASD